MCPAVLIDALHSQAQRVVVGERLGIDHAEVSEVVVFRGFVVDAFHAVLVVRVLVAPVTVVVFQHPLEILPVLHVDEVVDVERRCQRPAAAVFTVVRVGVCPAAVFRVALYEPCRVAVPG